MFWFNITIDYITNSFSGSSINSVKSEKEQIPKN